MDPRTVEAVERFKKALCELGIKPERVILYGSRARGASHDLSDSDLVVVSRSFVGKNLRERLELLGMAAVRVMEPIQALGYTPEEFEALGPGTFVGDEVKPVGIEV